MISGDLTYSRDTFIIIAVLSMFFHVGQSFEIFTCRALFRDAP